jgi:serine/threonine-protein kinase PknK
LTARRATADDTLRIVILDDNVLLRSGLASLLECLGHAVVGVTGDPSDLTELVRNRRPDLVIVDVSRPPTQTDAPLEAAVHIREKLPHVGILVLSTHVEAQRSSDLLASGHGFGYLLKDRIDDLEDLCDALRRVARGGCVLDPFVMNELLSARRREDPCESLSRRELDVLALMADGRSNIGIAHALWVAEGTVEKHVRSILTKLDLGNSPADHRRVLAVVAFLRNHRPEHQAGTDPDGAGAIFESRVPA